MNNAKRMHCTVGDLVVAVTDAALEVASDQRSAYQIAGVVVNLILRSSSQKIGDSGIDWYEKETIH